MTDLIDTSSVKVTVISERQNSKNGSYHKPTAWPPKPGAQPGTDDFDKHSHEGTKWTARLVKTLTLHEAFTKEFVDPTYFVMHKPTPAGRRLNHNIFSNEKALEFIGGCVEMHLAIFDVDAHEAPLGEEESERYSRVDAWFQDEIFKIEQLQEEMPGVIAYRSKNGYRLVALLEEPIKLRNREDCHGYAAQYTSWVKYLARKFDMKSSGTKGAKETADDLGDFTRFMRVPHDSNKSPLQTVPHLVLGDVTKIGYWKPNLEASDKPAQKSTSTRRVQDETLDKGCLLLQLVQNRGLRIEAPYSGDGDYDICCPDMDRHSPNANGEKDYPSKTRLFLGPVGMIDCKSEGCSHRKSNGMLWVKECFTPEELKQAEKDLGREWKPAQYDADEEARINAEAEAAHQNFCRLSEYWKETGTEPEGDWGSLNTPEFEAWCVTKGYSKVPSVQPETEYKDEPSHDLEHQLVRSKKGFTLWTKSNVEVACKMLGLTCSYDMLSCKFLVEGVPGKGPVVEDLLIDHLNIVFKEDLKFGQGDVFKYLQQICYDNRFHPIKDYLESLKWDGVPRLDTWLIQHGGAEDSPYTRAVSHLPLVALVRRVYEPGAKFDELLVLQSDQGKVKSSAIAALVPKSEWYTDSLPIGSSDKETVEKTAGKWIVEFADLHGLSNRDHDNLKSFLSRRVETCRPAFGRVARDFPRQWIGLGTINQTEYLTDPTGNRRYWPVTITKAFDVKAIAEVRDQLWAEAYERHCRGDSIRLDQSLWSAAAAKQKATEVQNPLQDKLSLILGDKCGKVPNSVLWDVMCVPMNQRAGNTKLAQAMTELGWAHKSFKLPKSTAVVRGYVKDGSTTVWLSIQNKSGEWQLVAKDPNFDDANMDPSYGSN